MKLVIMTLPTFFVEEDKILAALFDEGMDNLHLHKPGCEPMLSERLLSLLPEDAYGKTTVHEHYYLKAEYGLAGIHVDDPSADMPASYKGKLGITCARPDLLGEARRKADYVFLSGAFSSGTAEEAARLGAIDKHVYAMGGVCLDNIREAKDMGFGGVVVCEDLWSKFDIHNELDYKDLINHFDKLRKAVS